MKPAERFFWFKPLKDYLKNDQQQHQQQQPSGFVWSCLYSNTNEPNPRGRWARICHYRGYKIAWIELVKPKNEKIYFTWDCFPSDGNFNPIFISSENKTYEEAKAGVERRFLKFLETCR